jgi:hypothetical protein
VSPLATDVYFSHSYRDVAINGYFLGLFVEETIALQADQKTDVWCIAKLERYLRETTGFVSIIPARATNEDPGGYSPYIGQELLLARRSRVPRLLFVDDRVLARHRLDFPEDAVPFDAESVEGGQAVHTLAIRAFGARLETYYRGPAEPPRHQAVVIAGGTDALLHAAEDVAELLNRAGLAATQLRASRRSLDDVRLLERLWASELCVFLFGPELSETHVALAMAYAHGIPSIRLQHEPEPTEPSPSVTGLIRWHTHDEMVIEFDRQLHSYREGLVRPVELARDTTAPAAARAIGTMKWQARADNEWDVRDGPALVAHVVPEHRFVQDEVARARAELNRMLGGIVDREGSLEVCNVLYDGLERHHFGYEWEALTSAGGLQAIRTPTQIAAHHTATCLDVACLFASLLEASQQAPLLVVLEGDGFAHALVGYRVRSSPAWDSQTIGDLRGAVRLGDAVLVEATGVTEADSPVAAETAAERRGKLLAFSDAQAAATRMLVRADVSLRHFVDVAAVRAAA